MARKAKIECSLSESKLHIKNIRSLILAYEIAVPDNSIEKTPIKIIIKTDFVNIFLPRYLLKSDTSHPGRLRATEIDEPNFYSFNIVKELNSAQEKLAFPKRAAKIRNFFELPNIF